MTTPASAPPSSLPYRSDIDGLRAIAVLSVVLYHFGLPLRGGFVGVDVFFVISGFLIGGILWREYSATGRLRLLPFYLRRFRRLAPAFFAMAAVTSLVGWTLLMPQAYREYAKTLIAATVYLSNVQFWRGAGYFDSASEDKPLLHTWSLSVEEQFYIVLPVVMLLLARWRWGLLGVLAALWAGSLAASLILTPSHPVAAFYLFPFRAWELLSGVLLAIWGHETGRRWRGHPALGLVGLGLVLGSVVLVPSDGFPGLFAVPPVLGTVLLLANGTGQSMVNRLLSARPMVAVGLISYSLYLWHWPVYTLSIALRGHYSGPAEAMGWMALSFALGWLSWRVVETPIRRARGLRPWAVLGGMALASGAALGFGAVVYKADGLPARFGPRAEVHIAASGDFIQDFSRCAIAPDGPLAGQELCPIGPDGAPRVLIWGDSHVRAFHAGLDRAAHEAGVPGLVIWRAGCPPLFGVEKRESAATPAQDRACNDALRQIEAALPDLPALDAVLLIGRWTYYASGQGVGLDAHNTITLSAAADGPLTATEALLPEAATRTAQALGARAPVFVLRQPPEVPDYDSRLAARELAHAGWPLAAPPVTRADVPRPEAEARDALGRAIWQPAIAAGLVTPLESWPRFCDDLACHALHAADGGPTVGQYFDNNHLTNRAALRVRDLFAPVFAAAGAGQ